MAVDTESGRLGVLKKVARTALAKKIETLRREFDTMSRLAHPNIARVFDYGSDESSVFFFEEYVDGADVFESTKAADYNQILSCLVQILRALHYLHHQGTLHGDLKPENILVVRGAPLFREDAVKLIDFGLAKNVAEARHQKPSGTVHFMAPEVLTGKASDARSDLFAAGVCLYRMLAGRYPFEEERGNLGRLIDAQRKATPPEPRRFRADLSPGLNDLTMRLMAKSPADRYESAQAVLEALNAAEGERFPLWTETELKTALHEGPFLGRERELTVLQGLYDGGTRSFVVAGPEGIGKSRLIREFRTRLQLAGQDEEGVSFREEEGGNALQVPPWSAGETALFLKDRLRLENIPEAAGATASAVSGGIPLRLVTLIDFWLADGVVRIEAGRAAVDLSRLKHSLGFEEILRKKAAVLEGKKREILFLCAFSQTPLSAALLQRIVGGTADETEEALGRLEREGWLVRELDEGVYGYRVEGARREELLTSLESPASLEELSALVRETYRAGNLRRARHHLEQLIRRYGSGLDRAPREVRRGVFETASLVFLETDDLGEAEAYTRRLLGLPDLTDGERGKGLNRLGWIAYHRGRYDQARPIFGEAEVVWARSGETRGRASAENFLGMTCQALKDFEEALRHYAAALSLLPEGDDWVPMFRMNLALCAQEAGRYAEALEAYEKALAEAGPHRQIRASILSNLSNLYLYLGRLDRAGALGHASLKFAIENGLAGLEGQNYLFLAHVADRQGNLEEFRRCVDKAAAIFGRSGTAAEKARAGLYEAFYALTVSTASDDAGCRKILARLRAEFPGEQEVMAQCDLVEGKLALKADPPDVDRGAPCLEKAKAYYEARGDEANLWEVLNALGQLYRRERPEEAEAYLRRTLQILERLSEKIPEPYRASFYRDRKREKILKTLEQFRLNATQPSKGGAHHAERTH